MTGRYSAIALVLLASCSSSAASRHAPSTSLSSTTSGTRATAKANVTAMHWRMKVVPTVPEQKCGPSKLCVSRSAESGTVNGDLRGTTFRGNAAAFAKSAQFVVGVTQVFRGTVKGCGSGTLVFLGTELADVHRGSGDWTIPPGFGTGDGAHVTGHGMGTGNVRDQLAALPSPDEQPDFSESA